MTRELWNEAYREDHEQSVPADDLLDPELAGLAPGLALDLGCGTGRNALKLARLGWSVVGVDWAEEAIALARAAALAEGLDARFHVADITDWKPPLRFDLAISMFALPGGENTAPALRTAAEALAPGGTLLVAEWDRSMAAAWGLDEDELLSPEQIADLLPGLEIVVAEVRQMIVPAEGDEAGPEVGSPAQVAMVRALKS